MSDQIPKVQADVIREIADELQVNTWVDLIKGSMPQRISNTQRIVDWLRERADDIEGNPRP